MIFLRAICLLVSFLTALAVPASADEAQIREIIAKFATAKGFSATQTVVQELAATGDPSVETPLVALSDGDLIFRELRSRSFYRQGNR